MIEKIQLEPKDFVYCAFPKLAVLVTVIDKNDRSNIITVAWHTHLSHIPPLYCISIHPKRFSHDMILESKEFVLNFASFDIVNKLHYCGTHSGREHDKFKEGNLTPMKAFKVKAPLIKECYASLECTLYEHKKVGDHTLFIGEVIAVSADKDAFKNGILGDVQPIYYMGNNRYTTLSSQKKNLKFDKPQGYTGESR